MVKSNKMIQSTIQNHQLYEYLNNANDWVRRVFQTHPELRKPNTFRLINEVLVKEYGLTKYNNDKGLITLDRASRKVRNASEKYMDKEQEYRRFYA